MAIIDTIINIKNKVFSTSILGFNGAQEDELPNKLPIFPKWFFTARLGQPRSINITEVRAFAKSSWVQMVLNTIKKEVSIIDWDIVKTDIDDETNQSENIKKIKDFLNNVNTDNWDIIDMINPSITDIGEIDAATWVKVYSRDSYETKIVPVLDDYGRQKGTEEQLVLKEFGKRTLNELRLADSGTVLKQIDLYRRLQAYYQYSFKNPRSNPNKFEPDELCYMYMNKKSYSIYGFSPVQAIQQVLEVLIQSTRWNKEFFKNNAIPDGIIGLEGANPESMKKFKSSWMKEVKGKAHKLLFHNTKATFASFTGSARDMEWLEGQKWYFHLVFGIFGVSPTEAGFHENTNRSTQEGQERITVKNAIKPYLKVFEKAITKNIIKEILQDEDSGLEFKFQPKDHTEEETEFNQQMQELDHNTLTINEYRRLRGREPIEGGDEPLAQQNADLENTKEPKEEKMISYSKAFESFVSKEV